MKISKNSKGIGWEKENSNTNTDEENIDLTSYAKKTDLPTKTSQLTNDSGYLTEHQDISNYQTKADDTLTTNSKIVTGAINELNTNCVKLGTDLDDIILDIDKNILTRISSLESELDNKLESNDLSNYYNKPEVDKMIADVITGGAVDLSGYAKTSDIPTKTSELTNDSSYATESYVSNKIAEAKLEQSDVDLSGYQTKEDNMLETTNKTIVGAINEVNTNVMLKANKSDIPTKTSQLTNDSKFLTSIPSEYITETELNAKGYLTEHQDLSNYALKTEIPSVPTKTSQLTNDSGFITTIPSEYITESELTAKNYATTSQIPTSLPANGGNANTVGGFSVWVGTQTEYDTIATKSSTTIYLIKE